ncbi:Aromatic-L-amino-acid decarboxylase [hydrothermal vent metagenome]|uniref:Aromatic-L-amino-acid decarboxylase n=1 Tax=hydrothermal vent metagenome TaxID=652676 RepID=A0A3B1DS76_9ZZZZ
MPDHAPHLSPDEFRVLGHRMVDFVADYMGSVSMWPVKSQDNPGDVLTRLPESPPEVGLGASESPADAWGEVFDDLTRIILPGLTHWQHPAFFGYFPCNASGPAILGELLSAGLGVQGMLWQTSPACTELEMRMLDWMAEAFGLPACFRSDARDNGPDAPPTGGGVIQGSASEATLVALIAARQRWRRLQHERVRAHENNTGEIGLAVEAVGRQFAVICSEGAHSSVIKAAMMAGIAEGPDDDERVWQIATDSRGRMDIAHLRSVLEERAADPARPTPIACVATVGTTGVGAVDNIAEIAAVLRGSNIWLHIDAAWAGSAMVCPEYRAMIASIERADSVCINPHKWLLTNFDCDLFWTRSRHDLTDAMSITPEYLRNEASESGTVTDYRDWQLPLGRRFRSLKLWFVLRHYGLDGLRAHIREGVRLAEMVERFVKYDDRFELVVPRSLSLVCFRVVGPDDLTTRVIDRVNATGKAFLSHATWPGPGGAPRPIARLAIGGTHTREEHVRAVWILIQQATDELR